MTLPIRYPESDAERAEVEAFLRRTFPDMDPSAVPRERYDWMYAPTVLQVRDEGNRIVAALLSCRTQRTAAALMSKAPGLERYRALADKHRELDLVSVDPKWRGRGLGSRLLNEAERLHAEAGVRVWFGCVTVDLEADRLRAFYTRHGFTVLPDGEPLPPLLGLDWTGQDGWAPGYWFYKRIR